MIQPTRKQVYDLTLADFNAVPVWEFASDAEHIAGQDEATVRPYNVTPPIDTKAGYVQPVIISEAGQHPQ